MQPEWICFVLLLVCSMALVWQGAGSLGFRAWTCLAALALSTVAAALKWSSRASARMTDQAEVAKMLPREGRPDGYVSSQKCRACHPNEYATWHQTFHRTMTQFASFQSVRGDFENVHLQLAGETFHLYHKQGQFYVDMVDPVWKEVQLAAAKRDPRAAGRLQNLADGPRAQMRIGLLTGSHTMQVYWLSSQVGNLQLVFPFAWLIADRRWAPFHQTFLRDPATPPELQVWNNNCINCHATAGQPRQDARTEQYDTRVGELGIACEACHGPAGPHAAANQSPLHRYELHVSDHGDSSMVNPSHLPSKRASEVCGQCHGIKRIPNLPEWREIGFQFRPGAELDQTTPILQPSKLEAQPGMWKLLESSPRFLSDRYWSDGEVRVSGREFNGLIDSPCYQKGELSCLSCHSLHQSNPSGQLAARMEGNNACLQCHAGFKDKLREHTHHAAGSSGSECYNCHMPHTTYGLLKGIRSHRITSPSVAVELKTGRPNACNLCHLDRTLQWTADHLSQWYRQPETALDETRRTISDAVLLTLKGDAGQRALIAWHMGWEPAKKTSGADWLPPYLAQLLEDPYSAVRYIAGRSLRVFPQFKDVAFDFTSSVAEAKRAHDDVVVRWASESGGRFERPRPELLIQSQARLMDAPFNQLLQQRDNTSMDLQE